MKLDKKTISIIVLVIILIASWGYTYTVYSELTELRKRPIYQPLTDLDTLKIAMDISIIVSLDPARAYEGTSILIDNQCFDKLVDFIPPDYTTVVPEIAESWEVKPDGVTWIFHIRKGVKFSNGDPLDAEAVAYSLKRVITLKKEASWLLTQFVSDPNKITVINPYTVQVVLDKKVAPSLFLSVLSCTVSCIVNPKVVEAHAKGGDMGHEWMTMNAGSLGTGSGPFILQSFERESKVVLVANENYWRGPPKIKKIIIQHVPEPEVQRIMLEKGEVDIAWDLYGKILEELKGVEGIKIYETGSWDVTYIGMNVGVKPLNDYRVRKAIKYAIDYDAIINNILYKSAVKYQTVIPYGFLGFNPATPYYRDVAKAKALLAEAGYPQGFSIDLAVPAGAYPALDIAAKIKSDLAEVGINVNIVQITSATMYERYRAQALQMVLAGWGSDYPDPDCNAKAFGNWRIKQLAWRNKWYDNYTADLCELAMLEPDPAKRAAYYKEITDYILEYGPYVVLYHPLVRYAMRTWVEGFIISPSSYTQEFYTVYKDPVYKKIGG
jgi:peptide/nickel transport system substrate-binding protein